MAKKGKGKGNKPVSARGHREESTLRFRQESKLIRIDRKGRPLTREVPINTFSKDWLSNHLLNSETVAPPIDHSKTSPPTNVSSFAEAKAKRDKDKTARKPAKLQPQGWLHNTALATHEIKGWSRTTKEFGRKNVALVAWSEKDGKLYSDSLEKQRELSEAGHLKPKKPKAKAKVGKAPSTVHNPFLTEPKGKHKPLDLKFYMPPKVTGSAGLAPSGLPIRLFTEGKYKPKEKAVVYTTNTAPPTPTRDWRQGAVNDNRYDNAATNWVAKTNSMVQWFINHVEPQNWPTHVNNFVHWKDGGPLPNTGAINKAANSKDTEIHLLRSLHEGLEKDWRMLDSALEDSDQEVRLLRQELQATRNEVKLLEYDLAHRTGDQQSADAIRQEMTVGNAKPPEDADQMLFQFRMYKSFVRMEGEASAFARYVYNDPTLGQVMEDHADMRFKERETELHYRNLVRFLQDFASYQTIKLNEEYHKLWKDEYPKYRRRLARRNNTAVVNAGYESVSYAAMSRKAKPRSIYYSSLYPIISQCPVKQSAVNDMIAVSIIKDMPLNRRELHENTVAEYVRWWENQIPHAELNYAVKTQPIKAAVVKGYNSLMDTLNTEVNPFERKRKKDWIKNFQREQDEKREQRIEAKAKAKEEKAERDHIRKMQRMAH